ncbi:MAG: tRNA pseudouridine synthase A, partial [Chlamydiota bacterium]
SRTIRGAVISIRENVYLVGCGRTDAGVHALAHVSHFSLDHPIPCDRILYALNCMLPKDIRILSLSDIPLDFHARYSALRKIYHYHLSFGPSFNPFRRLYTHHFFTHWDLEKVKKAIPYFIGTHDFTSFANEAHQGSASRNATRTLFRLDLQEESPSLYRLEFEGNGFLYKMVRNIVGTLIDVGFNKIDPEEVPAIFAAKDRRKGGRTSPAQGLFLVSVLYPIHHTEQNSPLMTQNAEQSPPNTASSLSK